MNYEDLSPELLAKARACESAGELMALAKDEGIPLSDEELDGISGGHWLDKCHDMDLPPCVGYL